MSLKNAIEKIFSIQTDYTHPEQAINQAQSLNSLSTDLYTDSKRFIYELIQNADDSAKSGNQLDITISIINEYLIVAHTGKEFDERDVKGICGVNHGTKKNDSQKTGYKGIGFKAVFGQSDYVLIFTKGEYFRFDANYKPTWKTSWSTNQAKWEAENDRLVVYPWQITPIWTTNQEISKDVVNFIKAKGCSVATIIRLKNATEANKAIIELKSQSNMFLFLRNVNKINFEIGTPTTIFLKEDTATSIKEISISEGNGTSWLLKRIELDVPKEIRDKLQIPGMNIPEKLQKITKTELIFGAKTKDEQLFPLSPNESILYSFLPTDVKDYSFPILINAGFLTNANREQLHIDSPWNQWLFEQIGIELFKWIAILIKEKWKFQGYKLLPNRLTLNDNLADSFNKGFEKAIKEIPFVINSTGVLLKVEEVVIDLTSLNKTTFIGSEIIKEFITANNPAVKLNANAFMPFTEYSTQFKKLGVKAFEWKDLPKLLSSDSFNQKHEASKNKHLIQFLFDKANEIKEDKPITDTKLKEWSFILDHKGKLRLPTDTYFPPKDDSTWNDPSSELSFIHPDTIAWLTENVKISAWLQNIGVVERTDLTYLIKTIIPNASSYITNENAIRIVQWLFNLYIKEEIGKEEICQLRELKLLTNAGTLLAAEKCYFSDEYYPRLPLEKNCIEDIFVSKTYIISKTSDKEWKRFFSFMGVKEGVEILEFAHKEELSDLLATDLFLPEYFDESDKKHTPAINTFKADEYIGMQTLILLNKITNHSLAKMFWQDAIQNIDPKNLNKVATSFWGHSSYPGRITGDAVAGYINWYTKNISCIPTTEGRTSTSNDIFLNTQELTEIAGEYLPIFDIDLPKELSPDWKSFFQFKTELSLEDHLTLLLKMSLDQNEKGKVRQENRTRIQLIYEYLLSSLTNWGSKEITLVKTKSHDLEFLATDDTFKSSINLRHFSDGEISLFQGTYDFIHVTKTIKEHPNLKILLSYFGIEVLKIDNFGLEHKNESLATELESKLIQIAPYLANWVAHDKTLEYEQAIYEIQRQLDDKKFYEADTLALTYDSKTLKKVNVYYREKTIHVTRPWKSGMVMIDLPKKLCSIFGLNSYEKEIAFLLRESIEEIRAYFIQENIKLPVIPEFDNSTFEISDNEINQTNYSQTIDYVALKKLIEEENKELLKGLGDDPKEILIKGINKQNSLFKGHVYHFTHLENMGSILKEGLLKSRSKAVFKDSASLGAIGHTISEKKDYVRFYFRPKTPTQYYNENFGREDSLVKLGSEPVCPIPIFLKIPIEEILTQPSVQWEISLGNMAKASTQYGNNKELIKQFDFNGVYLEKDSNFQGRYFASSQQEFLVQNQLPLTSLNFEIICQDKSSMDSLKAILGKDNPLNAKISVDYTYFYNSNCKMNIASTETHFISELTKERNGEMILQYITEDPIYIEGDINATEELNRIKTVYSNLQIKLGGNLSAVEYSMFYSHKGELWLVSTNQNNPKYNFLYFKTVFDLLLAKKEIASLEIIEIFKTHPLLKYWYSHPIGGADKLSLEEHTLSVIENYQTYFSGHINLFGNDNHFKVILALHDIGKPKAVLEKRQELQHEYSLNLISLLSEKAPFFKDNFNKIKAIINADPIGKYLDPRFNMSISESTASIKSMSEQLGLSIKETWRNLLIYYQCDAAGYNSLRTKIFDNDAHGNLVYSEKKQRLLFSESVEEKFGKLEQAIIKLK